MIVKDWFTIDQVDEGTYIISEYNGDVHDG